MQGIDLYSGIGGWTLGLKLSGIRIGNSYEWWAEANKSHNKNLNLNHPTVDIRKLVMGFEIIRPELLPNPEEVDFVVGSPPCTQFSYANRGGNGDIDEGLIDIKAFLVIVDYLQPKCWAMENVPRVAGILHKEVFEKGGTLVKFRHLFNDDADTIQVYNSADFGVPQRRKRMIAGNFNHKLLNSYTDSIEKLTLGEVLDSLSINGNDKIKDPNYNLVISSDKLIDHREEDTLSNEEERLNRDSKNYHPVYNVMNFPEDCESPSRTVTALCTRVSRESIVVKGSKGYRRLTVRERACLQSFPITYQFFGNSYGSKLKMIGNAIPPIMAYYIACAMQGIKSPKAHHSIKQVHQLPEELPKIFDPPTNGVHFSASRRFTCAIPNLRFGSGMRFELNNRDFLLNDRSWKIDFYHGTSTNIIYKSLDSELLQELRNFKVISRMSWTDLEDEINKYLIHVSNEDIQSTWTHEEIIMHPHDIADFIGDLAIKLIDELVSSNVNSKKIVTTLLDFSSKKIERNSVEIIAGMVLGGFFNKSMNQKAQPELTSI